MSGLRTALTSCLNSYAKKRNMLKGEALSGDDAREGLTAIVSVKHPDPSFSSQTKDKLVSSEVTGIVQTVVYEKLGDFFEENPSVAKTVIEKALLASKERKAAQKARELTRRKGVLEGDPALQIALRSSRLKPNSSNMYATMSIREETQIQTT